MPTTVTIHQPNYLPWLGYFHKIAVADIFIFLDDVQYTKNSYINRVKVLGPNGVRWLTVPVSYTFGDAIGKVHPALPDWPTRHLDTLQTLYSHVPGFQAVWRRFKDLLLGVPKDDLATINRYLIESFCRELGLGCRFLASSEIGTKGKTGDERLVTLVTAVAPAGTYISGKGGAEYQDPEKFEKAGLGFRYVSFQHPLYDQCPNKFEAGLSIVDPLFRLGWSGTADLISKSMVAT
jgi:hypothetical protein